MAQGHQENAQEKALEAGLARHLEGHLREYIEFNLRQGYELSAILSCLRKYGYRKEDLSQLVSRLPSTRHQVNPPAYDPQELDEDTHNFLTGVLSEYIGKMRTHGYSLPAIEQALINYGHHPSIVREASTRATGRKRLRIPFSLVYSASVVLYAALLFLLLLQLDAPLELGALLFLPGLAVLLIHPLMLTLRRGRKVVPIVAIILTIAGFVGVTDWATSMLMDLSSVDLSMVLLVNVLFAAFFSLIMTMAAPTPGKRRQKEKETPKRASPATSSSRS